MNIVVYFAHHSIADCSLAFTICTGHSMVMLLEAVGKVTFIAESPLVGKLIQENITWFSWILTVCRVCRGYRPGRNPLVENQAIEQRRLMKRVA